ncbi:18053_t:CDS:2 [Acaulospora morrowiae]|uniref:18053_t:CDS:1 n=1 Tax=Acaulospora morrowiae TaxID=94023 RepID=A0A9N9I9G0_9GLOM|nr:18053_t:CDS:2 [Acaulospora morrowiae]
MRFPVSYNHDIFFGGHCEGKYGRRRPDFCLCLFEAIIGVIENFQLHLSLETNQKLRRGEIDDISKISIHFEKPTILDLAKEFEPLEKSARGILDRIV